MTGTYVAVRPSVETERNIQFWAEENNIILDDDLHVTVLYSRNTINVLRRLDTHQAVASKFEIFDDNTLVLCLKAKTLEWRHGQLIKAGGTHDFDKYRPHLTIQSGTRLKPKDLENLPLPNFLMFFSDEYNEPLAL